MFKSRNTLVILTTLFLASLLVPYTTQAQWGVGASYEIRTESPKDGFGVRIENSILPVLPIVDLRLRAHFSNFSAKNHLSYQDQTFSYSYSRTIQSYDYGITAVGGINFVLVEPYVGLGLGANTVHIKRTDLPQGIPLDPTANQSKFFWNALFGAEVNVLPMLHPFVEYRYTNVGKGFFQQLKEHGIPRPSSSNGRLILGVLLQF